MSKIILITHQKGGVGKSTLTFNLAQNLSQNCKVAILDMDVQGSLSQLSDTVQNIHITTDKTILESTTDVDLIFVDTPPYLSNELDYLISLSDLIIVPTKVGVLDLMAISGTLELVSNAKKSKSCMIVLNMVKPNTNLTDEILERLKRYDIAIAKNYLSDLVSFTRSVLAPIPETNSKAKRQLDGLTKEVLTALLHL